MKEFRAIAVQVKCNARDYMTFENFRRKTASLFERIKSLVRKDAPNLVVFPEDYGTPLVIASEKVNVENFRTLKEAMEKTIMRKLPYIFIKSFLLRASLVRSIFLANSEEIFRNYVETFREMAIEYSTYVVAGSITIPRIEINNNEVKLLRENKIFNTSLVFDPSGKIIGVQRKVHLIDIEGPKGLDISSGDLESIKVIETEFAKIGIAICFDAFHNDVVERLVKNDAEILIQPSANPEKWTSAQEEDWKKGCWSMVQKYNELKYGINPMMV
ncbi:MAG: carbon-nitrogen hydrolase family protein, partial [Thermoproteota archaeon]